MIDYEFYAANYMGDSIAEQDFHRLAKRAGDQLAQYKRVYDVTSPDEDAESMAICAMADALAYFEAVQNGSGGAVSAASIGSVSVSYAGAGNAVDTSQAGQERELYRCACMYLDICRGCG